MTPSRLGRFTIGDFSRLTRLSIRMLRYYDDRGLLTPSFVDPANGYRYYAAGQLEQANKIRLLRDLGLPVADITELLPLFAEPDALRASLARHRLHLEGEAHRIASQLAEIDRLSELLKEQIMSYEVRIIDVPAYHAASVRDTVPEYRDEGVLWDRLSKALPASGVTPIENDEVPCATAVFHDPEFRDRDVDIEIRMAVAEPFADTGDLRSLEVPAHRAASCILTGGYDGMGGVTEAIATAVVEQGLTFDGPMYNVYLVGPWSDPDPANWVTDVRFPVK